MREVIPSSDPDSASHRVCDWLVEHSDIPAEQVHQMHADRDNAPEAYQQSLQESLEWREKGHDRLDFVLLAPDGAEPALAIDGPPAAHRFVARHDAGVAMTDTLINAARCVAVLVTGGERRPLVDRLTSSSVDPLAEPLAAVRPVGGELRWYVDWAACNDANAAANGQREDRGNG